MHSTPANSLRVALMMAVMLLAATLHAARPGSPQTLMFGQHAIEWRGAERSATRGDEVAVLLQTNRGKIQGRYHPAAPSSPRRNQGVIWLSGARGGLEGPARALYPEASRRLQRAGIASLRIDYRNPADLTGSVLDALCGVAFFAEERISRVALVGHSFGGAVVICAGASSPRVRTVITLASQTAGAVQLAPQLTPRSLLIIHGTRDKVLPASNSRKIYEAAPEPKELRLLNDAGHGLTHAREELLTLLLRWIPEQLARPAR